MPSSILASHCAPVPRRFATQVLRDYEHWLLNQYGSTKSYLPYAKSFLVRFKDGGSVATQLETFTKSKNASARSLLNRFGNFLREKKIDALTNDLNEERLPKSSILVKLFMLSIKDRLRSPASRATYSTILNGYMLTVGDVSHIEKFTAERYIFSKNRSDFTIKLYASVIKGFVEWILSYLDAPDVELSPLELQIKNAFTKTSIHGLKQISTITTKSTDTTVYHKDSLTFKERDKLLKLNYEPHERAIIALMAWNGLRPIEVLRLTVKDIDLKRRLITIWGKGRSVRHKQVIPLFKVPCKELRTYLQGATGKRGKLFGKLTYKELHNIIMRNLDGIGVTKKRGPFSPHSLRHTAGQLLYDQGIALEYIQKTLRHKTMDSTLVYAQKAIDRSYFRKMRGL